MQQNDDNKDSMKSEHVPPSGSEEFARVSCQGSSLPTSGLEKSNDEGDPEKRVRRQGSHDLTATSDLPVDGPSSLKGIDGLQVKSQEEVVEIVAVAVEEEEGGGNRDSQETKVDSRVLVRALVVDTTVPAESSENSPSSLDPKTAALLRRGSDGSPPPPLDGSPKKGLVAQRRASFTKHNSVPNMEPILRTRSGSFYQKVSDGSSKSTRWISSPSKPEDTQEPSPVVAGEVTVEDEDEVTVEEEVPSETEESVVEERRGDCKKEEEGEEEGGEGEREDVSAGDGAALDGGTGDEVKDDDDEQEEEQEEGGDLETEDLQKSCEELHTRPTEPSDPVPSTTPLSTIPIVQKNGCRCM